MIWFIITTAVMQPPLVVGESYKRYEGCVDHSVGVLRRSHLSIKQIVDQAMTRCTSLEEKAVLESVKMMGGGADEARVQMIREQMRETMRLYAKEITTAE